jgi:hypothetical protein
MWPPSSRELPLALVFTIEEIARSWSYRHGGHPGQCGITGQDPFVLPLPRNGIAIQDANTKVVFGETEKVRTAAEGLVELGTIGEMFIHNPKQTSLRPDPLVEQGSTVFPHHYSALFASNFPSEYSSVQFR